MTQPIIIYADFAATEWKWVCHYIISLERIAKNSAVYTYIRVGEKEQNDVLRLLYDMYLEDTVTIVDLNYNLALHRVNVIMYGSEARGFCSIYNLRDRNIDCAHVNTTDGIELFFHKLFVDINIIYQNNLQLPDSFRPCQG